jgi:hypothetical protein
VVVNYSDYPWRVVWLLPCARTFAITSSVGTVPPCDV